MSSYDELAKVEPRRDRYGRYLITPRSGGSPVPHTRATTIAETLDDRYNLELWKLRQVAVGLASRPDLIAQVAAHTAEDKKLLNDVCRQAMDAAASSSGANLGTALHRIVERHVRGELEAIPDMFADRVAAFDAAIAAAGITLNPKLCERVAVLSEHTIAGTFDLGAHVEGRLHVADLKTGSSIEWGAVSFAVQLAIYARADSLYDFASDRHDDPPGFDTSRGLIIWLPATGEPRCEIHWLDLDAGAEALEHALWVRSWRKRRDLLAPFADGPGRAPSTAVVASRRSGPSVPLPRRIEPINPPPQPFEIDEGREDPTYLERAKARIAASGVPEEDQRRIAGWQRDALRARRPWRLTERSTERRYELLRAAVRLAAYTPTDAEALELLGLIIEDATVQESMTVGAVMGSLTIAEAIRLRETIDALNDGRSGLRANDSGRLELVAR